MTIFGVVGGPLLGIFTLGMFTESATQRGSVTGVLVGLAFTLWIGFGQPRPAPLTLGTSISGCSTGIATHNQTIATTEMMADTTLANRIEEDDGSPSEYFYLYRISYMWYSAIGFLVTFIIGLIVSNVARIILKEEQPELDPDLFIPWVAARIRKRRGAFSPASSNFDKVTLERRNTLSINTFQKDIRDSPTLNNTEL